MATRPTVIVIGAGLGGIAAAARLARSGYDVTVVEQNATPGGRCNQLVRDGHRFDTGPTLLLMPAVFAETYAALGARMDEHLDLRRIDPTYRLHFADGTALALTSDLNALQAQLEALEPGSFRGLLRYLVEGQQHYQLSLERFVGRNFRSLPEYFSLQNLPLLFKLNALVKHYPHIGTYFQHPQLKAAFTFQNMYLGLSPFDAPATYSLLQYTELVDGVWFPQGGLYRVVESLVSIAEDQGVRFRFDTPVARIDVAGTRAVGVTLRDGAHLRADVVVANADLPSVYRTLLPDTRLADHLEHKHYTCSTIMFYWGLDRVYPELGPHNVFLAGEYRASFDRIFKDLTLPDEPSFYVHAPARIDAQAAPPGADTLLVLVPVGHLNTTAPQDWDALRRRARAAVLQRLTNGNLADLAHHIKFEVSYTPQDWLREYSLAKGAAFSLSHTFWQVGYLRPQNRHPRYRNLYFVGGSTHPGTGLPMVLLSARLTVERIVAELGSPRSGAGVDPVQGQLVTAHQSAA